jgi:TRAP-type C4-dicarboxylate transport system substrate-binding protein
MPGGLYRGSFAFIMNEDAFADLPEEHQAALEEKVFGAPLSRALGGIWDDIDAQGRAATDAAGDNTVTPASEADVAAFQKMSDEIISSVLAEISEAGVDADAAYAQVKGAMAK